MSTAVAVNTYTHSVTYVTDKLLTSIKNIIRLSGLAPTKMANQWGVLDRGISKWLETKDLETVVLEVYSPTTNVLIGRWDFEICYGFSGDGSFWTDPEVIKYHIKKQGIWPGDCSYEIITTTKPGRPDVTGWNSTSFRSTTGFVKQSIGTGIDGSGLSAGIHYYRKAS